MEIEGEGYLPKPTPLRSPLAKRNMKKYCRYHRDYGHDTEECYQLKDEIEALIWQGHLRRYVRGPAPRSEVIVLEQATTEAEHDNRPPAGVIHMISAGLGNKGMPPPSQKRLKNIDDVITFSKNDLQGVQTPHDDAVVVASTIVKYDVKRILVDNGSSTNVLFYAVFSRMDLSKYRLHEVSIPLIGFTGDSVQVEGEITLPTTVGTSLRLSTVFLTYTVVRIPSAYNAILGRPGLNALRAVVSTYHLLVRFPTKYGIEEL